MFSGMRLKLLALPILGTLLLASGVTATTYYVDYTNGSDSNSGTSKTSAWQHAPGMRGCSASCASASPKAGDSIILKGGVTWPNASLPWNWTWSGSSSNSIYVGVDKDWYSGSSWTRPTLDAQKTPISGNNSFIRAASTNNVTWDNLELTGFNSNAPCNYGDCVGAMFTGSSGGIVVDHFYVHGWTHTGSASDDFTAFLGDTNSPYLGNAVLQNSIIDGSDSTNGGDSGSASYCWPNFKNNVIHDIPNGILPCGHGEISGNHVYNIKTSFTGSHENFLETLIADSNGVFYIHDNVFHSGIGEAAFIGNPNETDYVWNNVWYDLQSNGPELVQNQSAGRAVYFWNNTIVGGQNGTGYCLRQGHSASTPIIQFQNNHCISSASSAADPKLQGGVVTVSNNVLQTPSVASDQGFSVSSSIPYAPTSTTNATTSTDGFDLSSLAIGILASLTKDTSYGCKVGSDMQVNCPARTPVSRAGNWGIGAFQSGSSGNTAGSPKPPSGLAATISN